MKFQAMRSLCDDGFLTDEDFTPIACRACGGDYEGRECWEGSRHRKGPDCQWCTRGGQSPAQLLKWQAHRQSGVRTKS